MSSEASFSDERILFGRDFRAEDNAGLQQAAARPADDDAEAYFSKAARPSPQSLAGGSIL